MQKIEKPHIQSSLRFWNVKTKLIQNDIWQELDDGLWREFNLTNFFNNDQKSDLERRSFKPIFSDFITLYPSCSWDAGKSEIEEVKYFPELIDCKLGSFLSDAETYFYQFEGKKIGVHLSGGLDSSIIIGLLRHFKIPAVLVGIANNRYEFRTERKIQQIMSCWGEGDAVLIDVEDVLPYSDLNTLPTHQIPTDYISGYAQGKLIAEKFREKGVEVVFTGMGGDNLFQDSIHQDNFYWQPQEFRFYWQEDFLYEPNGISLIPFYAQPFVMNAIYSLRFGQKEDIPKTWARHFFEEFLPPELVNYSYYGDNMGTSISGILQEKNTIKVMFDAAHNLLESEYFSPKTTQSLFDNMLGYDMKNYVALASRISVAVWLHSLFTNKI